MNMGALAVCVIVWLEAIATPAALAASLPEGRWKKPAVTMTTALLLGAAVLNLTAAA